MTLRTGTSLTIARRKLKDLEDRVIEGWDPWCAPKPSFQTTIIDAIDSYIQSKANLRPKSLRADRSTLSLFEDTLPPHISVSLVEKRHIESFLGRDLTPASVRTYIARLSTFFDWCISESYCRSNPVKGIPKPKLHRKEKTYLTREQVERIIRGIEAESILKASTLKSGELLWMTDVIRVAVGTGMRLGELCSLRWSGVYLPDQRLTVKVTEDFVTKSGHERSIPVRGDALLTLQRLETERTVESDTFVFASRRGRVGDHAGLNPEYVSRRFRHFARLAKMPDGTTFHTLRHTYVSWMAMAGIPIPVVKELAGHADIRTTMMYSHLGPDSLSAAVERVFASVDDL